MAKRPTVEVDEDYLKEVMAGGASLPKRVEPAVAEVKQQQPPQMEQPV
jgi:hypothetical protein